MSFWKALIEDDEIRNRRNIVFFDNADTEFNVDVDECYAYFFKSPCKKRKLRFKMLSRNTFRRVDIDGDKVVVLDISLEFIELFDALDLGGLGLGENIFDFLLTLLFQSLLCGFCFIVRRFFLVRDFPLRGARSLSSPPRRPLSSVS